MDVIHTAIWVSDLETARSFFVDTLGLEETRSFTVDSTDNVYVGGDHGEIQLRFDPDRNHPTPDCSTIDHLAVSADDVDAIVDHIVEETDWSILDGPRTVKMVDWRVAFVEGPDGYVVELIEDLA